MIRKIAILFVFLITAIIPVSADYTLQVQALTNSPADGATVYLGVAPSAPVATVNLSVQMIPTAGWLNVTEIYDYSGTAGTNQAYSYYIRVNNTQDYLVSTLSVAASERVFSNTSMGIQVFAGDFFEVKRVQPTWTTNPLTNIVGGYVLIDTPDETDRGYPIYGMALSNSPADGAINYMGTRPAVPETVEGRNKIFIPTAGSLTQGHINDYSGTAGTAEAISYSMDVNSTDYLIETESVSANNRFFDNNSMSIPVQVGNYLEFKRLNPTWVTNPLTNVIGGTAWINTTDIHNINDGYPIHAFALTHTPGDAQTSYFGDRPIAPSTTAGTNKIYIRQDGRITKAGIYSYSGTAGSAETWSMYVRVNNAQDYLIQSLNLATNERMWINVSMDIPVVAGDYVEIKSVTSTMATNPATTIYGGGFYMEYENDLPEPSFTSTVPYGDPPHSVTFTDTSNVVSATNYDWYWTNIENSTSFHFSTDQNPAQSFDLGHFYIGLGVTNASGYANTTGDYLISVTDSGGYTGLVHQDVFMEGQNTLTLHFKNSENGDLIPIVGIYDQATSTMTNITNGTFIGTYGFEAKAFIFYSDGYIARTGTYFVDDDVEYTVQLVTSTTSNQNTWYTPWQVRIRIVDYYGTPLNNINVTANYIASTLPSTDTTWLVSAFGVDDTVANDMLNSSVAMAGNTDDNGGLSFTMFKSLQYRLTITNTTLSVASTKTLYPSDQEYVIYVRTAGQTAANNTLAMRNGTLPWYSVNSTHINLNMTYVDTSLCTNALTFRVWFRDNGTEVHNTTWSGFGAAYVYDNHTVPKAPIGTEYLWGYNATTVC
jgi:hypothetical protein